MTVKEEEVGKEMVVNKQVTKRATWNLPPTYPSLFFYPFLYGSVDHASKRRFRVSDKSVYLLSFQRLKCD